MTGLLSSCAWLKENLDHPDVRVVDTRWFLGEPGKGRRLYRQGHIPGALFMDLDDDLAAPTGPGRHPLPSRREFAAFLGRQGIGNRRRVVVYDQGSGAIAARLWWMLRDVGHSEVSVLDGGFSAWVAGGGPTSTEQPAPAPTTFEIGTGPTSTIDRENLRFRLGKVQIIDARPSERYRGENETIDPVAGHVPTSVSAPTTGNVGSAGLFKSPEQLVEHFEKMGLDPRRPVVSMCGSGVTACHNILALRMAGFPEATLYPGSWSDWSSSGFPAVTGPEPGHSPAPGRISDARRLESAR